MELKEMYDNTLLQLHLYNDVMQIIFSNLLQMFWLYLALLTRATVRWSRMWLVCLHLHLLLCSLHLIPRAEGPAGLAKPLHLALHHGLSLVASSMTLSTSSLLRAAGVTAVPSLEGKQIEEKVFTNKSTG